MGFSLVFVVGWGGAATLLGQLFSQHKTLLSQIGGGIVILFGLHTIGIFKLRWLDTNTRPALRLRSGQAWQSNNRWGHFSSGMMGVVFAAGWTPCIGTILGAILTLGLSQQTAGQAMVLASGYALGLGLPFLAISLLMDRTFTPSRFYLK